MGTLSHILEAEGLSTVGISLVLQMTEKLRPPRALFCAFPFGRPLGQPDNPEFQHEVLAASFSLLGEERGPVLRTFPVAIDEAADEMVACLLPPPDDNGEHPAVAEARGLLPAYRRSLDLRGRTNVGNIVTAEEIPDLVAKFVEVAAGRSFEEIGIHPKLLKSAAGDIRAYYEESALALIDHVPLARQVDAWIYAHTATGRVLVDAWSQLQRSEIPPSIWRNMVPAIFHPNTDSW